MPTPPKYQIFLMQDSTHYYVWNYATGTLTTTTTPTTLTHAPKGWEDIEVKVGRSATYHGLQREYSTHFEFVKDGAKIIRYLWLTGGSEAECKLVINIRNDFDYLYSSFISGDLDFISCNDLRDSISIAVKEAGAAALLKAYEDTEYEIEVDGADVIDVDIDPMLVTSHAKWIFTWPPGELPGFPIGSSPTTVNADNYPFVNFALVDSKINIGQSGQMSATPHSYLNDPTATNALLTSSDTLTNFVLKGRIRGSIINSTGGNINYSLHLLKSPGSVFLYVIKSGTIASGVTLNFDETFVSPALMSPLRY